MSQNNSIEKTMESAPFEQMFDDLAVVCEAVRPEENYPDPYALTTRWEELRGCFRADYDRVTDMDEMLFGGDITGFGARATAVFMRWEDEEGGGPSLPALMAHAIIHFDLDCSDSNVKSMFVAAALAEIPNVQHYHGNEHYRKVLFHTIRLIATHNQLHDGREGALSVTQIAVLLAASCIHDLGHEGGDNARDGVYTPGYLEQKSIDYARPYFEAVGLSRDDMGAVETIVFCTDITFFAGENSPCIRMKKIYRHYFEEGFAEDVSLMMMGKLRRYEDNPQLVLMAMLMHEADVASSAGMSYEWTVRETIKFMDERCMDVAGPKMILAFLSEQLGKTMFTKAGQALYGSAMMQIVQQAEKDVLAGKESF